MIFNFFRRKEKNELKPIVFVNSPLEDNKNDVIGINPIIKSITKVISKGANIIGVIANYGTGKSSLIELLSKEKGFYNRLITINMWDCLSSKLKSGIENNLSSSVSYLTKSFLYQLSLGYGNKKGKSSLSQYVNKRLSKRYGIISFSTTSRILWVFFGLSALVYAFYLIFGNDSSLWFCNFIGQDTWNILKDLSPAFIVISITFLIIGIKNTNLTYSYWKNQNQLEPDLNDVYDIYNDVAIRLYNKRRWKTKLIIIEDLDRISDQNTVFEFLRELYRFNNLLTKKLRRKIIFIISIKPESELACNNKNDKNIYAKFFDYSVNLKPLHVDDYEAVLLSIIKSSGYKQELMDLINEPITNDRLPNCFAWLIKGENLSIRNLKDRLNRAVSLFINLKNKNYIDAGINFNTCSAVTYLESKYEKEYYDLIKRENDFANVIRDAYIIRNSKHTYKEKHTQIMDKLASYNFNNPSFVQEVAEMILTGIIDDDFRMYFYSYPKDSYIKNSDEKDIENLILYPLDYTRDGQLDEKIERILGKYEKTKQTKNIILEAFERLDNDLSNNYPYPSIILYNQYLFRAGWRYDENKTLDLINQEVRWDEPTKKPESLFSQLYSYVQDKGAFLAAYSAYFYNQITNIKANLLISCRKELIRILGSNITVLKNAFYASKPLITDTELRDINDISIALQLIDPANITDDSIEYISMKINESDLNDNYNLAYNILRTAINTVSLSIISKKLLIFMQKNNSVDDLFFGYITNKKAQIEVSSIVNYINSLHVDRISDFYLDELDKLFINRDLNADILSKLELKGLYHTYILSMYNSNRLDELDYADERIKDLVINACEGILTINSNVIQHLRLSILKNSYNSVKDYWALFMDEYPLITEAELNCFGTIEEASMFINRAIVTTQNCDFLVTYINKQNRNANECFSIFEMFDPALAVSLTNGVIKKIVEFLDFIKIDFKGMSISQKEQSCKNIRDAMGLNDTKYAIAFMSRVNSLIPSLENSVISAGLIDDYIVLINQINEPTATTVKWLLNNTVDYALSPNNSIALFNNNQFEKYIIAKTLFDDEFNFDKKSIDPKVYLSVFNSNESVFKIMSRNEDFLRYIVLNKLFKGMEKSRLKVLYTVEQTADLLVLMLDTLDESEKIKYFKSIPGMNYDESRKFTTFLRTGDNYLKMNDLHLRKTVYNKINSKYRAVYTRFIDKKR